MWDFASRVSRFRIFTLRLHTRRSVGPWELRCCEAPRRHTKKHVSTVRVKKKPHGKAGEERRGEPGEEGRGEEREGEEREESRKQR